MKAGARLLAVSFFFLSAFAHAAGGHGRFGLNAGLGIPFLTQGGVNMYFSDNVGLDIDYGILSITSGQSKTSLSMPSALLKWHPFSGSFFIGAGVGQETLDSKATDVTTSETAEIKVTAMTAIGKLGWMWGSQDGGLWFGLDLSFISPSGAKTTITSDLPTTNSAYQDAQTQADKFGKTSYTNITFARLGFLF
jgi:hypothetical protein